jgi:hypothetical protein
MDNKIKVDYLDFHRLKNAVDEMQGGTFYCEDDEGVLRRWTPPRPFKDKEPLVEHKPPNL